MILILAHNPNDDLMHDHRAGYWTPPRDQGAPRVTWACCMDEARMMAERYIANNHLGGGNWTGLAGLVYDERKREWSRIAYNGRVFPAIETRYGATTEAISRRNVEQAEALIERFADECIERAADTLTDPKENQA